MLSVILALALTASAQQPLTVTDVQFRAPERAASCGLLRQREKERLKVIRELSFLTQKPGTIDDRSTYEYWLKKLFMPPEDWIELSTEVVMTVIAPEKLRLQAQTEGLGSVFLITRGPGFVWQSYADQLPPEMSIELDGEYLIVRYFTYLTTVCDPNLQPVTIDWVEDPYSLLE